MEVTHPLNVHQCKPFYVNIILRNKEDVVANAIAEKTGLKKGGLFGNIAGFAANQLISDEKVIGDLSSQLIEGVRSTVYEMGITATFKKRYQYHSYVVVRVSVAEIDRLTLVLAAKGADFAHHFSTLLAVAQNIGIGETVTNQVDTKIRDAVNESMKTKIGENIPKKLAAKGIHVDCVTCFADEQAEFFFDTLEELGIITDEEEVGDVSSSDGSEEEDAEFR